MKQKLSNGVAQLSDDQERMRLQVVDLELKARFWKAQYDIRHYTLEAERVQPEYNKYLEEQKKINEELMKKWQNEMNKLKTSPEVVTDEVNENEEI